MLLLRDMLRVICVEGYCDLTFTHEMAAHLLEAKCKKTINFAVFIPQFANFS